MKKNIPIIALTLMVLTNIDAVQGINVQAANNSVTTTSQSKHTTTFLNLPKYDGKDVVMMDGDPDTYGQTVGLYELKNGQLSYTGNKIKQFNGHYAQLWKADKTTINGKTCWQVGQNLYLKSKRIVKVTVNEKDAQYRSFGNDGNKNNMAKLSDDGMGPIQVNNPNGNYVPIMSLQKDGSFTQLENRSLANDSLWKTNQIRKYNDNVYCRIATNEWVNATAYVVK